MSKPVRHFALWQKKEPVILIGYSKRHNDVLAIKLEQLPEDEREELKVIALNPNIQTKYELTPTLQNTKHSKSGETWMTNIAMRLRRHDGSVIKCWVKDLYDVDEAQLAYYKGYGPEDAPGRLRISEAEKMAVLGDDYRQLQMRSTTGSSSINPPMEEVSFGDGGKGDTTETVATAQSAPPNDALAAALSAVAAGLGQMNQVLARIDANTAPGKPGRPKGAKTKKASSKTVPASEMTGNVED